MTQAEKAINYMLNRGPLTRQIAFMSLDIANLTAVISDVRDLGVEVEMEIKSDPKGRNYAKYYIPEGMKKLMKSRRVITLKVNGEYTFNCHYNHI